MDETQRYSFADRRQIHIYIWSKVWSYSFASHRRLEPENTLPAEKGLRNLWMPNKHDPSNWTLCVSYSCRLVCSFKLPFIWKWILLNNKFQFMPLNPEVCSTLVTNKSGTHNFREGCVTFIEYKKRFLNNSPI